MDILSETYLKNIRQSIEDFNWKKRENQNQWRSSKEIKEYAAEDADVTLQLKKYLQLKWHKTETKNFWNWNPQ
jgi:DNA polymerase-1